VHKTKLYLDSCVFLNVWFDELVNEGRSFAASKRLLEEIINCTYHLTISKLTIIEITKKMNTTEDTIMNYFLKQFQIIGKLKIIKLTEKIAEEAVHFGSSYGVHKADALHAMLAKMNGCVLVTLDNELLEAAKRFSVPAKKPDELIS
jgi:predicted nucleic acid-binding protein